MRGVHFPQPRRAVNPPPRFGSVPLTAVSPCCKIRYSLVPYRLGNVWSPSRKRDFGFFPPSPDMSERISQGFPHAWDVRYRVLTSNPKVFFFVLRFKALRARATFLLQRGFPFCNKVPEGTPPSGRAGFDPQHFFLFQMQLFRAGTIPADSHSLFFPVRLVRGL